MNDAASTASLEQTDFIGLATTIVAAYVSNNSIPVSELPALLSAVYGAISGLGSPVAAAEPKADRVTPGQIRKSITHEALISFEDGKPYKTLKRHLTKLGLTPEQYREKWSLPQDYPLVAAGYSESRSALAKSFGLGQKHRPADLEADDVAKAPKARGRR